MKDEATGKAKYVVSGLDKIGEAADEADRKLGKLGKKKVHPIIDADNNKLLKKMRESENKVAKLAGKTATVTLKILDKGTDIVNKLEGGLKKVVGKTWTTVVKIKDLATAPLRKLKDTLFSIKTLVMAISAGLAAKQFVINPVNLADAYSSAQIGFSTLLGESQGQQMMNNLDQFAKATPFKSSEVISQTQRMLAMGWDADRIIEDMTTIGDAAAATGKGEEGLQRIVTALAQIQSKGKLSTEELNQLAEAGVSAKRYIAEGLGYGSGDEGIAKMTEDLESGAIASGKAVDAILSGMKEYQGMMDKTANETVKGLWSQIQDTFEINIFRKWGQGLQDGAKKAFGSVVTLLDEADGALEKFGDTIYELGSSISNWLADKFEKAVERILEITDTFEFQEAGLGKKFSMLWKGLISDPLKEWWENGGQEKTAETAGEIGSWMGKTISKGLLAIFGATDALGDGAESEAAGKSIAGSFVKGFKDNFDGQAITDAFVKAIKNVWNALPAWGKVLVGGYAGSKALSFGGSLVSGIANLAGGIKGIGTFGANTAINLGAGNLPGNASMSTLGLATTGLGAIAGGVTAGAGLIHIGSSSVDAYKSFKEGDTRSGWANVAKASGTAVGMAGGAAIGAKLGAGAGAFFGGVGAIPGALIGAGIGTLVGWFAGDEIAKNIEAARFEVEAYGDAWAEAETQEEKAEVLAEAQWDHAKRNFGDIKLSMTEIKRLVDQIVWSDDLGSFEKFSAATNDAKANLESLKAATVETDRWMWKAGLGVKFNDDEKGAITQSFNDYISAAQSYLENTHYEFTASAALILDLDSTEGKSIMEGGNAFYAAQKTELDKAGQELGDALTAALADGIINADEEELILAAQAKISSITEKIANAESAAQMELIKVKFGGGNLDADSFDSFMETMQTTLEERSASLDEALEVQIKNLALRFPDGGTQYEQELQALVDGYKAKVEGVKADVLDVELNILSDTFKNDLGDDAAEDLKNILEYSLKTNIDPVDIPIDELLQLVGEEELDPGAEANLREYLSQVAAHLGEMEVNTDLLLKANVTTDESIGDKAKDALTGNVPEKIEDTITLDITGEPYFEAMEVLMEDFGIDSTQAANILFYLSGQSTVVDQVDIIAAQFGIPKEDAATVLWNLTGQKGVIDEIGLSASDFGVAGPFRFNPVINIAARRGTVSGISLKTSDLYSVSEYRGGIVGGSSAMSSFARGGIAGFSDGGIVRGGSQLIEVAEEGSPEMIIPLSSQRRDRALKLWEKAGQMLDVPGFARGGRTDNRDEGLRFHGYGSEEVRGGQTVEVDVGGITLEIHVNGTDAQSIAEAIKAQVADIAEDVAGIMADAFSAQFENTPVRGGAA